MRGLPRLKVNFEYEKRKKEQPMKVPKAPTLNLARMRKLVLLLLFFLYFSFVLAKANAIARSNTTLRHDIVTLNLQIRPTTKN